MPNDIVSRFLLVFLTIETILQETTIYRRRQKLRAMGNSLDLGGAHQATLERIKAQGGEQAKLGMAVLTWVSHSRRPLQVDEICHAIAIRIGSNDLNSDDIPAISTLLSCCQGLATIEKGTSAIRLVHVTLQEYLCAHPNLFDGAHSTMAETCLTYLNFPRVKDLLAGPFPDPRDTPFLEYSSLYWGIHMRMEVTDRAKALALQILDQFAGHISAKFLWESIGRDLVRREFPWLCTPNRKRFSALHCISYFGVAEVANSLIKMDRWDVNKRDGAGMTPLAWAARQGHEEVVRLLLRKKHIQSYQQDTNSGRTALSWAAAKGHEGAARTLLGPRFVNLRSIGHRWRKASRAVSVLFSGRYTKPDISSKFGRTPLSLAAENGHEGIVKLLLGRGDVNPAIPDTSYGRTPLSWAAVGGHEGIVRLLLGRKDVNPDRSNGYDGTLLVWAAKNGHEGIVKLLLGREDVDPNSSSKHGRTPLSWAAWNGHEGTVQLLLERGDVNPNTIDTAYSQTPLSWAAQYGHEGVAKLLLGRGDTNPDSSSKSGRTPLSLAAENGHEGIVKLLVERGDINPDSSGKSGRTPLSLAAGNGHEGIVKLLLGREDVDPDTPDAHGGWTPLSWAAGNGHQGVVELLLGREDVDPNTLSKSGQTPFSLAVQNRSHGVAELLRARHSRPI